MLGYYVSMDSLDEWNTGMICNISIETPFHFVEQVYVSLNHVIYFLYQTSQKCYTLYQIYFLWDMETYSE